MSKSNTSAHAKMSGIMGRIRARVVEVNSTDKMLNNKKFKSGLDKLL